MWHEEIEGKISSSLKPDKVLIDGILSRARDLNGLSEEEAALLLNIEEGEMIERLLHHAGEVKRMALGDRISFFAPLYLSNHCTNNCLYCGFRRDNKRAVRLTLSQEAIIAEARFLEEEGFRRILLVTGEDGRKNGVPYLTDAIKAIRRETGIKRISINPPPMPAEGIRKLREAGAELYQSFQETYHMDTYALMHPSGRKKDYNWRVGTMERAFEAGFHEIGIGALLGLYDFRFEVLALLRHASLLHSRYGIIPAALSMPRLRPALGSLLDKPPYPVSDMEFKKALAVYRLALPYTEIAISTRESGRLRDEAIRIGASMLSAGSRTDPGGYTRPVSTGQFEIEDGRSLDTMVKRVKSYGMEPDF